VSALRMGVFAQCSGFPATCFRSDFTSEEMLFWRGLACSRLLHFATFQRQANMLGWQEQLLARHKLKAMFAKHLRPARAQSAPRSLRVSNRLPRRQQRRRKRVATEDKHVGAVGSFVDLS
jgi:hypothetical protein